MNLNELTMKFTIDLIHFRHIQALSYLQPDLSAPGGSLTFQAHHEGRRNTSQVVWGGLRGGALAPRQGGPPGEAAPLARSTSTRDVYVFIRIS